MRKYFEMTALAPHEPLSLFKRRCYGVWKIELIYSISRENKTNLATTRIQVLDEMAKIHAYSLNDRSWMSSIRTSTFKELTTSDENYSDVWKIHCVFVMHCWFMQESRILCKVHSSLVLEYRVNSSNRDHQVFAIDNAHRILENSNIGDLKLIKGNVFAAVCFQTFANIWTQKLLS